MRASKQGPRVRTALEEEGARVTYVKLAIDMKDVKRTQLVEVYAQRSQLVYDRRDPLVERTLLAWLAERGIWVGGQRERMASEIPREIPA